MPAGAHHDAPAVSPEMLQQISKASPSRGKLSPQATDEGETPLGSTIEDTPHPSRLAPSHPREDVEVPDLRISDRVVHGVGVALEVLARRTAEPLPAHRAEHRRADGLDGLRVRRLEQKLPRRRASLRACTRT